jgi:dihydroorotase
MLLIKSALIVDPNSPHNGKKKDILIKDGKIIEISETIEPKGAEIIETENLHVSPGWFDMRVNFRDPGFEHKEDIVSGISAAAFGGFTGVACMPATNPPIHSKSEVEYLRNRAAEFIVDVYPVGTISHKREGKDMAEMYDMYMAGAVAFSDEKRPVSDPGLMLRALLYTQPFNGLIISYADDKSISLEGKVNEGIVSTVTGLKGIPALAEEIMVARDIYLAEYTNSKLHFATVSTARSVELIREAKAKGLKITAETTAHNLALSEKELETFDSHYKVKPPLRTESDIESLITGLKDGTIDAICSDHSPEDEEMKKREFDHAAFGIIGLETAYAVINTTLKGKISLEEIIRKIAINPRNILNIPVPIINTGQVANITLFDPEREWVFQKSDIRSKSSNTPFIGTKFKGKALAVYNKGAFSGLH